MRPLVVIELEIPGNAPSGIFHRLVFVEIDLLILQGSPQPLYEDIVKGPASGVHADPDAVIDEHFCKCIARKL